MLSMPPAAMTFLWPSCMLCAANIIVFMPLAHTLLIVVASVESFSPAFNATWRAGDCPTPA